MGTLFDQRARHESIKGCARGGLTDMLDIMGVTTKPTIEQWLCACRMLEVGLKYQSADILDEQLAGFGEIVRDLAANVGRIAESLDT